ncbi:MAG: hypothetical protein ACRCXX_14485 [Cetobacterium sp.]|uniref:hypothetical protein n=1 Tax=Cetobacterium sp. TaxID=2071632 RepID=UPI003F2F499A
MFLFTILYIVLSHSKKYDEEKFFDNLNFSLITFEISATTLSIYIVAKIVSDLSKFLLLVMINVFKKIGGKK